MTVNSAPGDGPGPAARDRSQSGDALQECLRTLDEVQQVGRIGSWRYWMSEDRLWWSDGLYRVFGIDRENAPPSLRRLVSLIHPDDREAFEAQVACREPHRSEYRIVLPDGSVKHIHEEVRVERDELGVPVRMYGTAQDVTDRMRIEEELAGQRATLQQILDTSSIAIFLMDRSGRITHANRCMAEMFGRAAAELIGEKYVALVHPSERELGRAKMLALLASEIAAVDLERRYLRADGTEFWGHLTGKRFHDARGVELGLLGVISDVTERRRAEEALRKNERMLQAIIETEPECVKLLDADGGLIFMNRAGLDMIQAETLGQVRGACVCPMVGAEHRQDFLELTKRVFRGESGDLLFEMVGLRGRRLWLEMHAVPLRDEKDEIVALLGVTRDVTERRRVEEALRSSEARFRSITENASVGILVADVETGRFRYANPTICRLLGYEAGEFSVLAPEDLAAPEERPESAAGYWAHAEGRLRASERTFRRKDGSTVRVSISSVPMEFDGRPCIVGFFADITERRLLEEERLKAQKLESIGTLAGGIAHDFNNLLQGIFGYLSLARFSLDRREEALAMLDQADQALHQSVSLTTQLLTFSKGGKPLRRVIDLKPVIENAVKFALSGSRVTYELSFGENLRSIDADEGQIGQVIQNIVLNSEQAMPLGGRIEISVRNAPASRAVELPLPTGAGFVEIVVRDQGLGIPAAHLPRIFDPYFTTKEKGSGLGLATSYSIVKNHEGAITVQSELGKGSTFTVLLPAATARPEQSAAAATRPSCAPCRVLVMDDEKLVRAVASELLRVLGHEVTLAEDGAAAVAQYTAAKAAGRPFEVVILDLTIRGGMGGEETLRRLREIDPAVKAVVSSGYSDDEVAASFRDHGFCAFLKKPYNIGELSRALAEALA